MVLSPEAQRILKSFREYADNERLERNVNPEKVKQVMKREEERAKDTLFDAAKTIRAERNFRETFGDTEYNRQIGRTGREPAEEREERVTREYRERRMPPEPKTQIERFVLEREETLHIRHQEEEDEQQFFDLQQALTEEPQRNLDDHV